MLSSPSSQQRSLHVVYCMDRQDCDDHLVVADACNQSAQRRCGRERKMYQEEHAAYQIATSSPKHACYIHKVAAVPMLASDGATIIGSGYLLQATYEECQRFILSDPFAIQKVWKSVSIHRYDEMGSSAKPPYYPSAPSRNNAASLADHNMEQTCSAPSPMIRSANTA